MNKEENLKLAKIQFDANKALDKVFITEDGNVFTNEKKARKHGKNVVETIERKNVYKTKNEPQQ